MNETTALLLVNIVLVLLDFFTTMLLHMRIRSKCCGGEVYMEPADVEIPVHVPRHTRINE